MNDKAQINSGKGNESSPGETNQPNVNISNGESKMTEFDNRAPHTITRSKTESRQFMEDLEAANTLNIRRSDIDLDEALSRQFYNDDEKDQDDEILTPKSYMVSLTFPILVNCFILLLAVALIEFNSQFLPIVNQKCNVVDNYWAYEWSFGVVFIVSVLYLAFHIKFQGIVVKLFRYVFLVVYSIVFFCMIVLDYIFLMRYEKKYSRLYTTCMITFLVNCHILVISCFRANSRFNPAKCIMISFFINFLILAIQHFIFLSNKQKVYEIMIVYLISFLHAFYLNYNFLFILMFRKTTPWAVIGNFWIDIFLNFPFEISRKYEKKRLSIKIDTMS